MLPLKPKQDKTFRKTKANSKLQLELIFISSNKAGGGGEGRGGQEVKGSISGSDSGRQHLYSWLSLLLTCRGAVCFNPIPSTRVSLRRLTTRCSCDHLFLQMGNRQSKWQTPDGARHNQLLWGSGVPHHYLLRFSSVFSKPGTPKTLGGASK